MNRKVLLTPIAIVLMLSASAATAFASGEKDDTDSDEYGPWNGRGGYGRMMDGPRGYRDDGDWNRGRMMDDPRGDWRGGDWRNTQGEWPELETSSYDGRLSLEEERLPELVTASGERYSLVVRFPIAAENLPENGAAISVEAVEAPITRRDWSGSDKYLMVVSAEVDGVNLTPDWPEDWPGNGPFGGMHGGMYGGPMHGGFGGPGSNGGPRRGRWESSRP